MKILNVKAPKKNANTIRKRKVKKKARNFEKPKGI
jgi:hypothetical protein